MFLNTIFHCFCSILAFCVLSLFFFFFKFFVLLYFMRLISIKTAHAENNVRIINKWNIMCAEITLYAFLIIWIKTKHDVMVKFDRVDSLNRICHCVQM